MTLQRSFSAALYSHRSRWHCLPLLLPAASAPRSPLPALSDASPFAFAADERQAERTTSALAHAPLLLISGEQLLPLSFAYIIWCGGGFSQHDSVSAAAHRKKALLSRSTPVVISI